MDTFTDPETQRRAREESEEQLRLVLENTVDIIYALSVPDGKIRYISRQVEQWGYAADELIGKYFLDYIHPDDRERVLHYFKTSGEEGSGFITRFRIVTQSGQALTIEEHGNVVRRDGQVEQITGVLRDITERVQAEEELARNRNHLEEQAYLAAAIEILPMPVMFRTPDYQISLCNQAAKTLRERLGIDEHVPAIVLDAQTHTPIPLDQQPPMRALRGEIVDKFEMLFTLPDGGEIPIIAHAAPVHLNGEIVAAVIVVEDITALKEADRAKDEFLAILSQELQTPLTSVLSWAELAYERPSAEFQQQALDAIYANARRLKGLVAEILDLSKLIHRKMSIEPHQLDLGYEAHLAANGIRRVAEDRGITVTVLPDSHPCPILADPIRLQQCLGNLLQNSLKFTPAGGMVTIGCSQEDDAAVLTVRDTGRGLTPEALATVFIPFRQVERDERFGGLGLGLTLVRGIVELHGGRVEASSDGPGQGSAFRILLPLHSEGMMASE